MSLYQPESTLDAARARYFEINGFEGNGYDAGRVKMRAGTVPIWFPNTAAIFALPIYVPANNKCLSFWSF